MQKSKLKQYSSNVQYGVRPISLGVFCLKKYGLEIGLLMAAGENINVTKGLKVTGTIF